MRYEYLARIYNPKDRAGDDFSQMEILNKHGDDGWELVSVIKNGDDFIFYFMRGKK